MLYLVQTAEKLLRMTALFPHFGGVCDEAPVTSSHLQIFFSQQRLKSYKFLNKMKMHIYATPEIRGDIATFQIKIFFCANATWQGSLGWKEGKQELRFRSALEFVKCPHPA